MSRLTFVPALLLCFTSLTVACADEARAPSDVDQASAPTSGLETAALGLQGGYVSADDKNVVALISLSNQGMGSCSGSLIAPNLVLTAQHCVAGLNTGAYVQCGVSTFTGTTPANQVYVTTETSLPNLDHLYKGVSQIIIPPGSGACGRDIALMILDNQVDSLAAAPLIPRVDTEHKSGDIYSAIGYGEIGDNAGGSGTRRRRDGLSTYCVSNKCPHWMQSTDEEWVGEAGTCSGDSGGPAIDAQNRVIGVVSRGGEGCTYPTYSGVEAWGDWIKENALYAAQLGGYEAPAWATGWPTHPDYSYSVGETCDGPSWCDSGLCADGYCTRRCNADAPCPTGFICDGELEQCVLAPVGGNCSTNEECASGLCASGYCTRGCTDSLPCPTNHVCDANQQVCLPATLGDSCVVDVDCVVGFCHDGSCTRPC
ncbi:MAG: trypsin-like serine protease, partial [Myxococcota bacterium]|nr:trypsin-like serine protease [Myxococcota bacterium]